MIHYRNSSKRDARQTAKTYMTLLADTRKYQSLELSIFLRMRAHHCQDFIYPILIQRFNMIPTGVSDVLFINTTILFLKFIWRFRELDYLHNYEN